MSQLKQPTPWQPPSPFPDSYALERVVLRFFTPDDAPSMLAALDADRASFMPWLPWTQSDNRTLAEVIFNIERFRRDRERASPAPDTFGIGIFDARTGDVLGGTSFHRVAHDRLEGEIGYWVRPDRRRQGICTEGVAGMLSWGFTPQARGGWGFRRLHIRCGGANAASRRVPEKLGLRREVTIRAERWIPGLGWDETLGWGVLAEEWDAERRALKNR